MCSLTFIILTTIYYISNFKIERVVCLPLSINAHWMCWLASVLLTWRYAPTSYSSAGKVMSSCSWAPIFQYWNPPRSQIFPWSCLLAPLQLCCCFFFFLVAMEDSHLLSFSLLTASCANLNIILLFFSSTSSSYSSGWLSSCSLLDCIYSSLWVGKSV